MANSLINKLETTGSPLSFNGTTPERGVNAPTLIIPLDPDSLQTSQLDPQTPPTQYINNLPG
tara:strand:+ start:887 stop:1072 length:186 start_codon:yes stop_codon:yes gene_type:complete